MIVVCEPQCKGLSHEKVNSGFLYGLRLAFPDERIRFYGHASHIDALRDILVHDHVSISDLEYVPIEFATNPGFLRAAGYVPMLLRLFADCVRLGTDKLFFLSFTPEILQEIKLLKTLREFRRLKFTLVLHGAFESIAKDPPGARVEAPPFVTTSQVGESVWTRLRRIPIAKVAPKVAKALVHRVRGVAERVSPWRAVSERLISVRGTMLWRHSEDFRYVCLSPHVRRNAARYLDVEHLGFHTVILPTVFAPISPRPLNRHAKFAVFGYGDPNALHTVLSCLSKWTIEREYEIRVIGSDNRGTHGFANVGCVSPGRRLSRADMERHASDIDMFLILYDKSRYRLSCSGSILESMSYLKPVLHLDNDCVNNFNCTDAPIGIRCESLERVATTIKDVAEHYDAYGAAFDTFRQNMVRVRQACAIEGSVNALRTSFSW